MVQTHLKVVLVEAQKVIQKELADLTQKAALIDQLLGSSVPKPKVKKHYQTTDRSAQGQSPMPGLRSFMYNVLCHMPEQTASIADLTRRARRRYRSDLPINTISNRVTNALSTHSRIRHAGPGLWKVA